MLAVHDSAMQLDLAALRPDVLVRLLGRRYLLLHRGRVRVSLSDGRQFG